MKKKTEGTINWSHTEIGGKESVLERIRKQYGNDEIIIKKQEILPYYMLTYQEKDEPTTKVHMKIELTKINGILYMDAYPHDILDTWRFASNYIGGHTFAKVEFNQANPMIAAFNGSFIEELIKQKRIRLKHEVVDEDIILTASTTELRAFINKYGQEPSLFEESDELIPL